MTDNAAQRRGRVEVDEDWNDWRNVPTRTWRTYLDDDLLGNADSEDEGWRWINDMLRMETV